MKALTARVLSEIIMADQVSKKRDGSGNFIFRKGYYYSHGGTSDKFVNNITQQCKDNNLNIEVVDSGDHWAAFNGGASIAKSSHWWVVAKVTRNEK